MPNEYTLMRMSEDEDEDGCDYDDFLPEPENWEEEYLAYYDDCKLKNSTRQDW